MGMIWLKLGREKQDPPVQPDQVPSFEPDKQVGYPRNALGFLLTTKVCSPRPVLNPSKIVLVQKTIVDSNHTGKPLG